MNTQILIVEGTSGVGKSTLIDALIRKYVSGNKKIRSLLHLTQAHTYGPLAEDEDRHSLTKEKNLVHLDSIYNLLNWSTISIKTEHKVKFFALLDTLHLTHCVRPGVLHWDDIKEYDAKLKSIDCKLIYLYAHPQTIWDRGIEPRQHEQFITGYGKKFGNNLNEIHQYFINEQILLEKLYSNSQLNKMDIHVEDDLDFNVEKCFNFWIN